MRALSCPNFSCPNLQPIDSLATYSRNALRLGIQGVELLSTGRITVPVPEPSRERLRSIRRGEVPVDDVLAAIDQTQAEFLRLQTSTVVPAQPRSTVVDKWLHRSHWACWSTLPAWACRRIGRRPARSDWVDWTSKSLDLSLITLML